MTARRRVVVDRAADESSFVCADDRIEEVLLAPRGNRLVMLWGRDGPAALPAPGEGGVPWAFIPPPGGWRVSLLTFPPDDSPPLAEGVGVSLPDLAAQMAKGGGKGMHTTPTLDVVLIVSGELWLEVDDGSEVRLVAGDTVVQNGTRHAWRNKSSEPATLALFMVGVDHADA